MSASKRGGGKRLGRKASTVRTVEPPRPEGPQEQVNAFTRLPDRVVTVILDLLDWHSRINMESTCRRLKKLVNDGPWTRSARFTLNDLPTAFTIATSPSRSEAITELDVSNYVLANSDRLAAGIGRCKNLVVLRCIHCRLAPATLFLLLRNNLTMLESLYWSVIEEPTDGFPAVPDDGPGDKKRGDKSAVVPATLTRMYVEAVNEPSSIAFVEAALMVCHSLRSLHFHELEGYNKVTAVAYRILHSLRWGTRDNFDDMTYTCQYATSYALPPTYPLPSQENILRDFGGYVGMYTNVRLNLTPERSCNCVTIAELELTSTVRSHKQLTVLISEDGEETISRMTRATCSGTCRHIEALTLVSLPEAEELFSVNKMRNQAALCNFIRSCVALTELNLSVFHFSRDFDCCSVIATGGLDNLRALAICPCALGNPGNLELLTRASFKLRELSIRSDLTRETCKICHRKTTCHDASLVALRRFRHLTHLTLCELYQTRSLDFLIGCASLLHLRLRNMGMWRVDDYNQDMSPIAGLWTQLHTLKLESILDPIDYSFIRSVPVSQSLSRVCLGSVIQTEFVQGIVPHKLALVCPAAKVIHLHAWHVEKQRKSEICVLTTPFTRGDRIEGKGNTLFVSPMDTSWLCNCLNTIGIPKQYGIK